MARQYAQVRVALWEVDDDFRALPVEAQHLYFVLLTSPTLNMAGVGDWRPKRIARLAHGWTPRQVEQAAAVLAQRSYIATDSDSEEFLIRTFVRHDGVLRNPKTAIAMASAWGRVYSQCLRAILATQVQDLAGDGVSDTVREAIRSLLDYQPDRSCDTQSDQVSVPPVTINHQPSTINHRAKLALFDDFWREYPKREAKGAAERAWAKAVRKADPSTIVAGAVAYAELCKGRERRFIKNPATWLNADCWLDESPALIDPPRPEPRYVPSYHGDPDDLDAYQRWYATSHDDPAAVADYHRWYAARHPEAS